MGLKSCRSHWCGRCMLWMHTILTETMAARCHAWIDCRKDTGRSLSNPAPVGHTHKHPPSAELSPALGQSTSSAGRVKRQRELAGLRRGARRRILLACCHDLTLQRRERRSAHSVQAHGTPCLWIFIPQFTATVTLDISLTCACALCQRKCDSFPRIGSFERWNSANESNSLKRCIKTRIGRYNNLLFFTLV